MSCYGHKSPPFALYRVKRRENKKKKEPSVSLVRNIYTEYEQPFLLMASAEWLNLYFFSLSLFYTSILWPVSFQMKKKKKKKGAVQTRDWCDWFGRIYLLHWFRRACVNDKSRKREKGETMFHYRGLVRGRAVLLITLLMLCGTKRVGAGT